MKYTLKNLKYLVFTLTFVIVGFAFSNSAHAGQYTYGCADGGTVTSNVSISPTGPFSAGSTTPFNVIVSSITSTCTSRAITLTAQNNAGTVHTLVNQTFTGTQGPFFDSVNFAAPSSAGTYAVHFITGVDEPATFAYVRIVEVSSQTGSVEACGQGNGDYPYLHTVYRADFFSDVNGTIPMDVSGLNLQLRQERYFEVPTWISSVLGTEVVYTPVASGTSYTYDGFSYDAGPTNGYGCSSTDQQLAYYGYSTLEGTALPPTPYLLIPEPPVANISGPAGAYQGQAFDVSWSSQYATSCSGTNFSTGSSTSGATSVTQSGQTTYTLSCSNILGTDVASIVVDDWGVYVPPVTCDGWSGAISCNPPGYCDEDKDHSGYQVCVY